MNKERSVCHMHLFDKIPKSTLGQLTRSRKEEIVNPFPAWDEYQMTLVDLLEADVMHRSSVLSIPLVIALTPSIGGKANLGTPL